MPAPVYQFGVYQLHCGQFELTRDGRSIAVERKPMELLILFAERSGELVTRAEIAERLWDPAVFVDTEHGINTAVRKVRQALRDDGDEPRYVQTVLGKGYRFVAPVERCVTSAPDERDGVALTATAVQAEMAAPEVAGYPAAAETILPATATRESRPRGWRWVWGSPAALVVCAGLGWWSGLGRRPAAMSVARAVAGIPAGRSAVIPTWTATPANEAAAHEAYVEGRYLWFRGNPAALQLFEKAVKLAPEYAPGWNGISMFYGQAAGNTMAPSEALPLAEKAAIQAVQLDPGSAEAHASRAMAFFEADWDWQHGDQELVRALEIDPRYAQGWHLRGKFLATLNRYEEAVASQKRAAELAPFERPWGTADVFNLSRRWDSAIDDLQRRLQATPQDADLTFMLANSYRRKGMQKEAVQALARGCALARATACAAGVQRSFAQGGYPAVVRWRIAEWEERAKKQYMSPAQVASLHAELKERDAALGFLEQGLRSHDPNLLFVQSDPAFDFLHADQRYRSVIQTVGLPPAW